MLAINKKSKFSLLTGCATFVISSLLAVPAVQAQSFDNDIINAADMGNVSQIYTLVGMGQDVNAVGRFGVTALHRAAYNDSVDVGQALIESGASLNPKDAGGATPLHIAARRGNVDFIQLLVKNGVDIDSRDSEGFTSLQRAIASDNDTAAVNLIAFGANANIANNAGETAVTTATQRNDQVVLRAINGRSAAKAPVAGKSDVVAAPVALVAEGEVPEVSYKPVIVKARRDVAPANQFDQNLELKEAEAPVLVVPAQTHPVAIPMPVESTPVQSANSNVPKSMQFASSGSRSNAVVAPVAAPVFIPASEPVHIQPAPLAAKDPVVKTKAIDVAEEPMIDLQPVAEAPVHHTIIPASENAWNSSADSQTAEIKAPGYNNVINLDKSSAGVRANGILVSPAPVVAAQPAPIAFSEPAAAEHEVVKNEVVPAAHIAPAVVNEPVEHKKSASDKKLPKSMQANTNFNEVAEVTPLTNEVSGHIITPITAAPTLPVEGLEKQPIVKQEVVTTTNAANEIVKQEVTTTNLDVKNKLPASMRPVETIPAVVPQVPAAPIAQPAAETIADPIEKRAGDLINEPLNFNKYDTPTTTGTGALGYDATLKTIEDRRNNAATTATATSDSSSVNAAAAGLVGVAAGAAAIKAADNDWGGLSETDIERLNKEIESKESAAKKAEKKAAKKAADEAKAVDKKTAAKVKDTGAGALEVTDHDSESTKKKVEETLNKQFDEKTPAKEEVALAQKDTVKRPDEKQSDAGTAKLVSTNQNKTAEVAHVTEEELKAPEMPAELTPPLLPGAQAKAEVKATNNEVPKPAEAVATPAAKMNEMPALPEIGSAAKPAVEPAKEAVASLDDKDFESKLKGIEAKKNDAPKKEEKFALNESISSSEMEAVEDKSKPKSVFEDIKKMEARKADIYAIVGGFANSDAANKHYNNIAGKTGLVFPYKLVKSSVDSKTYLQLGPVEDVRITEDICASFAVESKTCRVPSISEEDKKFMGTLKTQGEKKVYSLIGEFKSEKDAKDFYDKTASEKSLTFKYKVLKDPKGKSYGLQVGPLVNGGESKDVCDALKTENNSCVVSVK